MANQALRSEDHAANRIEDGAARIVIVGGGTAGWMTAALLSHSLTTQECVITVVDDGAGGIGVGEATIPSIVQLVRTLGGDEAEFMRACDATWKLGIQFCNWKNEGHTTWHPFGQCGAVLDERDLFSYWLADQQRPYHSYSVNWAAALAGKSPHARNSLSPISATGSYAFHLNAAQLVEWLKKRALANGTLVVHQRVERVEANGEGQVASVRLRDGHQVSGDLFVDCSGFDGVLMRTCAQQKWVDSDAQLLCDKAVTLRLPATNVKPPFTTATALSAGWAWEIPLMTRRGVGYVYSSQFVSDEDAVEELKVNVGASENTVEIEPQFLTMQVGRHAQAWIGNVVAIGLSAGFVEPLESSGLHLIQTAIERLLQYLPTPNTTEKAQDALRTQYNAEAAKQYDEVRDFVQLHYLVSERDEPFWKAARETLQSAALQHRLRLYKEIGMLDVLQSSAFPDASYYYLLAGNGWLPKRPAALSLSVEREQLQIVLQAILDQNQSALRQLPLHEEMLQHVHATGAAKAS
ncbi:MAG: tryptophan 7-halogenase [Fuerstiella sp.]|nr:tryptophan 7-halogenase [Fuerstiella sp.]